MEKGLGLLLLLLLAFPTYASNMTPEKVSTVLSTYEPPPINPPWGEGLEGDRAAGGSWSQYDYHTLFDFNFIKVDLVVDLLSSKAIYEQSLEETDRLHILYYTNPSYYELVPDFNKLENAYEKYSTGVVDLTDRTVVLGREQAEELRSAILGIRGDGPPGEFYNKYSSLISRLNLEPEYCRERRADNTTRRYICGFREAGPLPSTISLSTEMLYTLGVDTFGSISRLARDILFAGKNMHDAYITTASKLIEAYHDAYDVLLPESVGKLEKVYEDLQTSGYCDLENSPTTVCGEILPICTRVQDFVLDTEREQSSYFKLKEYIDKFSLSLSQGFPKWASFFKGILAMEDFLLFSEEQYNSEKVALRQIERKVSDSIGTISTKLQAIEQLLDKYSYQKFSKIDSLVTRSGINLGDSVAWLHSKYESDVTGLKEEVKNIRKTWEGEGGQYIYSTCQRLTSIERELPSLYTKVKELENDAKYTVAYWRNEAERVIEEGKEKGLNMSSAEEEFIRGEQEQLLGNKYERYVEAFYLASTILSTTLPEEEGVLENESIQALIAEVESLIDRAKRDGIDVSEEESRLHWVIENPDKNNVFVTLLDIKRSIVSKAIQAYSDLPGLREEVYSYIEMDPDFFAPVRWDVESAEAGIIINGVINYEKGLGKLNALRNAYHRALQEILEMISGLGDVSSDIVVGVPNYIPFNEEVEIPIYLYLENPYPFEVGGELDEDLPLELEVSYDDGKLKIRGKGNSIKIRYSLDPFEAESVTLHSTKMLGTLNKVADNKYGEDGLIFEKKEYVADVEWGDSYYLLPFYGTVVVEGRNLGFTDTVDGHLLNEGPKSLIVTTPLDYQYTWERGEISMIRKGPQWEVSYDIAVEVPIDGLEYITIPLFSKESQGEIDMNGIFDIEGNVLKIYNPSKGSFLVHVKYYEDTDIREELEDEVEELEEELNSTDEYEDYADELEDIKEDIEEGNYEDAKEKIDDIKEEIRESKEEWEKYGPYVEDVLAQIAAEKASINEALDNIKSDEYGLSNVFRDRESYLDQLVNGIKEHISNKEYRSAYLEAKKYSRTAFVRDLLKIAKDMKKKKDTLMKGYYRSGLRNETVDDLSKEFEKVFSLVRTQISNKYIYIVSMENVLEKLSALVDHLVKNKDEIMSDAEREYKETEKQVEELLEQYEELYRKAKDLGLEEYLSPSPSYYRKKLSTLPTGSEASFKYSTNMLRKMEEDMRKTVQNLKEMAEKKAHRALSLYYALKDRLPSNIKAKADSLVEEISNALESGDYLLALGRAEELLKLLSRVKIKSPSNIGMLLLFTVLSVALIVGYSNKDKIMSLLKREKKDKKLRKLRRGDDTPPT